MPFALFCNLLTTKWGKNVAFYGLMILEIYLQPTVGKIHSLVVKCTSGALETFPNIPNIFLRRGRSSMLLCIPLVAMLLYFNHISYLQCQYIWMDCISSTKNPFCKLESIHQNIFATT